MNLQELTDALGRFDPAANVWLDFGGRPIELVSWRGVYSELSLDWDADQFPPTPVAVLLTDCRAALAGKVFQGYKGGEFTMRPDTPVYADRWGDSNHQHLVGVVNHYGTAVLRTQWAGDYS